MRPRRRCLPLTSNVRQHQHTSSLLGGSLIEIYHGNDEAMHNAFQTWRRLNPDGFDLTEGPVCQFRLHWAQDKRDNSQGRGCIHQGGSSNALQS